MSIIGLHEEETGAALPRYQAPRRVAPEPKFSVWGTLTAAPRAVAEAGGQVLASVAEITAAYGDTMARMESGESLQARDPNFQSDFAELLRDRGRSFRPDPQDAHAAEQVIYGFARGASKVIGGAMVAGPFGIVAAGGEEAMSAADDLERQGVTDKATRMKAAGVQGAGLALATLPLVGQTLPQTAALYLAGGPGWFVAQQSLTREILRAGGFDKVAEQYDPLDPVGLAVSALVPAVFTAAGIRSQRRAAAVSREVEDAARVALQAEQRQASNPAPGALRSADAHEAALARAEDAVARGEPVLVPDNTGRPAFEPIEAFLARERVKAEALPPEVPGDFYAWVRSVGGIDIAQKLDIGGDANNVRGNPAGIFRQGGAATDSLADAAIRDGYLRPGASSGDFVELVQAALRGEPVRTFDQQMAAAARMEAEASMQARLEAVEGRLRLLGVDPAPARGNVAALEAYAKAHEPAILRAALDEARAADEARPEFDELRARAEQVARDIEDGGRTLDAYEREVMPLSPVMRRLVGEAMQSRPAIQPEAPRATTDIQPAAAAAEQPATGTTPAASAEATASASRLEAIRAQFPDLTVQIDGMDKPMRLDDFLAVVKAEADEMAADAPLYQVAAECALLHAA